MSLWSSIGGFQWLSSGNGDQGFTLYRDWFAGIVWNVVVGVLDDARLPWPVTSGRGSSYCSH